MSSLSDLDLHMRLAERTLLKHPSSADHDLYARWAEHTASGAELADLFARARAEQSENDASSPGA